MARAKQCLPGAHIIATTFLQVGPTRVHLSYRAPIASSFGHTLPQPRSCPAARSRVGVLRPRIVAHQNADSSKVGFDSADRRKNRTAVA